MSELQRLVNYSTCLQFFQWNNIFLCHTLHSFLVVYADDLIYSMELGVNFGTVSSS